MDKKTTERIISQIEKGGMPCIDSRLARPGDIFFALKGESSDGNDYAHQALENGCSLAIVDREVKPASSSIIQVVNTLEALQNLGQYYRRRFAIPFLGITGSNGKTTTKELIQSVLSTTFTSSATSGNLNNHIGVPLTLLSLKKGTEISTVEMGANHQGEISLLCEIAMPTHGLITNIGKAHIEGFGSIETVKKSKGELFAHIKDSKGVIFVNSDDDMVSDLATNLPGPAEYVRYGSKSGQHCRGNIISSFPFLEISYFADRDFGKASKGIQGNLKTQLTGSYNFENVLAAATVALYFGVSPENIKTGIESYLPSNNRSQIVKTPQDNLVVLDAYNANPTSVEAAILNFCNYGSENSAVMLGDMLELGEIAGEEHRKIVRYVADKGFGLSIFVGSHFSSAISGMDKKSGNILVFEDVAGACKYLAYNPVTNSRILLKGSRGIGMEKLLKHL